MQGIILGLIVFTTTCSCELDSDFELPDFKEPVVEIEANGNIRGVISEYLQSGEEIYTFSESANTIIEGIVVSSDEAGNFYKRLVIQDEGNDTGEMRGIILMIDLRAYFTRYELGRKVYVRMAGLSIRGKQGVYELGYRRMGEMSAIPESLLDRFIVRSDFRANLETQVSKTSDLNEYRLNTRIKIRQVQFEEPDLGKTFAGEPYDSYNALRPLRICNDEAPIFLSTSIYADFKSELLPDAVFDLEGILSREYEGQLVLIVNSPEDFILTGESRCNRDYLSCEPSADEETGQIISGPSKQAIFYEDFEQITSTKGIEEAGWTNLNRHYGTGQFVKRSSNDNTFVRISSYGTQESVVDVWLVSPPVELDRSNEEELTFLTRATFHEGRLLTVWITGDYDKDPREAQWRELEARVSEGSADGSNERFISSGRIDLDCVQGTVRIAFRYLGGDPGPSTNYDIDNILIRGRVQ